MADVNQIKRKAIQKRRACNSEIAQAIFVILCLLGYVYNNKDPFNVAVEKCMAFYIIFLLIMGSFKYILRIFYFIEEYKHLHSRYGSSKRTLLYDVLYLHHFIIIISCGLVFLALYFSLHEKFVKDLNCFNFLLILPSYATLDILNMDNYPLRISLNMDKLNGLDYGSGMAHSYFNGYLKIILPHTGRESSGIKELMKNYESTHNVMFSFYKLFVLIPSSLKCPTSLIEVSNIIEESDSLETQELDRAGVKKRPYKNPVYKIKTSCGKRYISAEYATPLKTLEEVILTSHPHGHVYKKYKNDVILSFYCTLKKLLDDCEDCKDVCELVFYNDEYDKVNVGKLLLQKIDKMTEKAKKSQ